MRWKQVGEKAWSLVLGLLIAALIGLLMAIVALRFEDALSREPLLAMALGAGSALLASWVYWRMGLGPEVRLDQEALREAFLIFAVMGAYFVLIRPIQGYTDYILVGFAMFFLPGLKRRVGQLRLRP